jgi:hypothetical protein
MDGHPHQPGPDQRAVLGTGAVDVGSGQRFRARSKLETRRVSVLRLSADYLPRDLDRVLGGGRPVKELGRGPATGQLGAQ